MPSIKRLTEDERVYTDKRLSVGAKGFYAVVMNTTGNPNEITETFQEEKDTLTRYIKELRDTGYCKVSKEVITFGKKERTDPIWKFEITDELREWALTKGASFSLENATEEWRDYHLKKGDKIKDYPASWRTWIRNQIKFNPKIETKPVDITTQFYTNRAKPKVIL